MDLEDGLAEVEEIEAEGEADEASASMLEAMTLLGDVLVIDKPLVNPTVTSG